MADANTSSSQQSQDAQTLDNLTSLQQPNDAEQSSVTQNNTARIDSPVSTPNAPTQDSPSLYNEVTQTANSSQEQTAVGSDSTLSSEEVVSTGRKSDARVDSSGPEVVAMSVTVGVTEEAATSPPGIENLSGSSGEAGPIDPMVGSSGKRSASSSSTVASERVVEVAATKNEQVSSDSVNVESVIPDSVPGIVEQAPLAPVSVSVAQEPTPVASVTVPTAIDSSTPTTPTVDPSPINNPPSFTSGTTATVSENVSISTAVYTAVAADVDAGAVVTYSLSGADAALFNIDSSTGVVTFKASPNYEAPLDSGANNVYDLSVSASDGTNITTQAVAITVTNVNEAPAFTSGATATVAENISTSTAVYTAVATDVDAGTTLTYSLSGTDAALFNIDSTTGAVTFKASPNYESPADAGGNNVYDISVSASDGTNITTQAVAITVTNVNEAPTFTSGATATVSENVSTSTAVYTAVATDVDAGTTLTYSLSGTDAALFNIDPSTGVVTFKASPNYESPADAGGNNVYDISVSASDGTLTTTQAVAITVTNVNEAPAFTSGATATVAENISTSTAVYTAVATDVDAGTTLTYSLSGADAALFNIDPSTGVVTFKASPNYESPADAGGNNVYDISVSASDGTNITTQAVAITVTNVNEAPTFTSGATATVAENISTSTAVYTAVATDVDAGTTLTYSLSGADAALFNIDSSTGVVTFKASPNYEAALDSGANNVYDISVSASDGTNITTQAVAITVTNMNEAPAFTSGATATVSENVSTSTAVYTAVATDVDAATTLTYSLSGADAARFNINTSTGVVTFKASPNYESPTDVGGNNVYDISVSASDGTLTTTQAVAITVTNVNEAPTFTSAATASVAENISTSTAVYTAVATDVDAGTTLTYSLSGTDAALFNINAATGAVTFKASPNYEAPLDSGANNVYDINVNASDGTNTTTQAVAVTVTDVAEVIPGSSFTATSTANETFTGTSGVDTFNFATGTSTFTIGGTGNSGTITGYDTIVGYQSSNGLAGSADRLQLPGTVSVLANVTKGNYADSTLTIGGSFVQSHSVSNGVITFVTGNNDATLGTVVVVDSTAKLAAVVQYLSKADIGNTGRTAIFKANIGDGNSTFVYTQTSNSAGGELYYLKAFSDPTNLLTSNTFTTNKTIYATPVALDLDGNGIYYHDQSFGVTFDYNKDGIAESTAWVAQGDGLLANWDANGKINIVYSTQAGETDLEGLAKVYDTNKDGVFDSKDAAFSQFGVWQDADSNGVVAGGEFKSLIEADITSISLQATGETAVAANGDVIVYGQTTFTTADGKTHVAEDVGFATAENLQVKTESSTTSETKEVAVTDAVAHVVDPAAAMLQSVDPTHEVSTTTTAVTEHTDGVTTAAVTDHPTGTTSVHASVSDVQVIDSLTAVNQMIVPSSHEAVVGGSEPLYLELGGVTYVIEPNLDTATHSQSFAADMSYHVGDPAPLVAGAWTEVVVSSIGVESPLVVTAWTDVVDGTAHAAVEASVPAITGPVVTPEPIVTASTEAQADPTLSNPTIHNL